MVRLSGQARRFSDVAGELDQVAPNEPNPDHHIVPDKSAASFNPFANNVWCSLCSRVAHRGAADDPTTTERVRSNADWFSPAIARAVVGADEIRTVWNL